MRLLQNASKSAYIAYKEGRYPSFAKVSDINILRSQTPEMALKELTI
ncbi:MAG: hypothetical protein MI674_00970 [Cytophagales bacterium]|nr:hypothetical protein [Cytophagales bacterium]